MEYRVLGTLEVLRDGERVDLGPFRQRAMLAMLLTAPNRVFSTDQLIDGLWGDDGTADRQNSLWVYVSGLRKALEPDREKRSEGTILLTRAPGYTISCKPDEIDAVRFERMIAEGRALAETDPAAASLVLGEALALWRGRAFEEFTYESFAQTEIARLEALRVETVEARIDADLDRGLSRELLSELETLTREHPLQERLTGQLMLALYRSGRQADALRSYQQLRTRLGEELGVEPSAAIRRLEEQMVTGDPALETGVRATLPGSGPQAGLAVRGYEIREQLGEGAFGMAYRAYQPAVGREVAMTVIRPELANDPDFIRRFETEAQLVARLEHPHIVPLYDYWREPDAAYLVMRLMGGGTLAGVLEERALAPDEADQLIEQVGSALQAAHRAGVVHQDVKPDNILVDHDGNSYLSDFGIAIGAETPALVGAAPEMLGPPFASPEALEGGEATPTGDIYSLGVVIAQALTGLSGEIVQVRGALPPPVLPVIDRATAPEAGDRYPSVAEFVADMRDALAGPGSQPAVAGDVDLRGDGAAELDNPYKGLRSFGPNDSGDFFGRERLVDRLVARLGEAGTRGRFVAVVGPSGSGKSSVVKAGLIPALRRGALPLSENWFTIDMTPAPHPFEELEDALLGIAVDPPKSLLEQLAGENGLQRTLRRVMPEAESQLLLVIDQFEELFTQVDADTASRFLDVLASAVRDEHSRVRVLVTLRADFYDRPLRHRAIGELVRDGTEAITPMTPEELARAITGPVEHLGVTYEPSLIAQLVRDVIDRSGALPLLQYTLTELFDSRQGLRITDAAYHELGGVSGALVERAEGLLVRLGDHAHDATRQVFLRLVTLGEGSDDTRRRVLRGELEQLAVDGEVLDGVLDTFGRHRLLSFDRDPVTRSPTVEISHEALLTEWTRLRDWIDGARHDVRNQRRLAEAMGEWAAAGHDDGYLLRGGRLDQLNGWATTTSLPLSEPEQAYLHASVAERERAENEERDRERRAVDADRRARQRTRQLLWAGVTASLVAVLAVFGIVQWRSAADARADSDNLVEANRLVSEARGVLDADADLSILLAVEAVRSTADQGFAIEEAIDAVHWALYEKGVTYDLVTDETEVAVRPGPRGPTGVWVLAPADLVAFAESMAGRVLTDDECVRHLGGSCQTTEPLDAGVSFIRGRESYGAVAPDPGALAGTTVEWLDPQAARPPSGMISQFTDSTGIEIAAELVRSGIPELVAGDVQTDVVNAQFGSEIVDLVSPETSRAKDLSTYLDADLLRSDFSPNVMSYATIGPAGEWRSEAGSIYGIPVKLAPKGFVFYPLQAFESAGYEPPETLDGLVDLSRRMVADGHTPWCFGYQTPEFPPITGWPGTDILESTVLRIAGPQFYDSWSRHEVPFDAEPVRAAGRFVDSIISGPGFVRGGRQSIATTPYGASLEVMVASASDGGEPECWMYHQQADMLQIFAVDSAVGVDLGVFPLPSAGEGGPAAMTGTVRYAMAVADRPEVREFMRYLASPQRGELAAGMHEWGVFISPNTRFDTAAYGGEAGVDDPVRRWVVELGEEVRDTLLADAYVLDAGDELSGSMEGFPFFAGMTDHAIGARTMDQVLADVEAELVAFEARAPADSG